ncbi:MAG: hypothetical protein OH316_00210 [Candidatus Parvarchaeota archaeon]|nr:hypothetical protein [Candidatus Parvarchaeota archaeon]
MDDLNSLEGLRSKIESLLSRGPALIGDISEAIGKDTAQTSVILDYYASAGKIFKTRRKYGLSPVYSLDRDAALGKLYESLSIAEKKIVDKFKSNGLIRGDELTSAERYLLQSLEDFVKKFTAIDRDSGEKVDMYSYYKLSEEDIKRELNKGKESEPVGYYKANGMEANTPRRQAKTAHNASSTDEINLILSNKFIRPEKLSKNIYIAGYGQYNTQVIVAVMLKSSLTKKDILRVLGYSTDKKTIAFILTNASKITGLEGYGSSINIVKI